MTLYSLPSGTISSNAPVRKALLHSVAHSIPFPRRPRKQPVLRFSQTPNEVRSSYNLDSALDNSFIYHRRAANVHLLVLLVEFSLHAELDRFENIVHRHLGLVRWLGTLLEDATAHQDRIPRI